jgi:hypothetical protein
MRILPLAAVAVVLVGGPHPGVTQADRVATLQIPRSIHAEHETILSALTAATKAPGRAGAAARELAALLQPHFVREEEIALPPLGLLAPLSAGRPVANAADALAMTDTLKRELPRMLDEHTKIRSAVQKMRAEATAEKNEAVRELADHLALHASTEEEVLYPAAVLTGDIIRARGAAK